MLQRRLLLGLKGSAASLGVQAFSTHESGAKFKFTDIYSVEGQRHDVNIADQASNMVFESGLDRCKKPPAFGIMFDIDGVLVLPRQIVLSHSPLRNMNILHDKHVVLSGQGPLQEVASSCGFTNVSTIDEISDAYPYLDMNDRRKRLHMPPDRSCGLLKAEGIILMGEPINWETHLQILIDLLITNGTPSSPLSSIPNDNLPIIAVNPDLLWMSEAPNPRFGNGAFLCCLESLYKKLTGNDLVYTSVLGKPNLFTYKYAEDCLRKETAKLHGNEIRLQRIYAIGDNLDTDIYGANLYQKYLQSHKEHRPKCDEDDYCKVKLNNTDVKTMESVLVNTGVSAIERSFPQKGINHLHRDTPHQAGMTMPSYVVNDVLEAVQLIFRKENIIEN
eukprot:gene13708-15136_t